MEPRASFSVRLTSTKSMHMPLAPVAGLKRCLGPEKTVMPLCWKGCWKEAKKLCEWCFCKWSRKVRMELYTSINENERGTWGYPGFSRLRFRICIAGCPHALLMALQNMSSVRSTMCTPQYVIRTVAKLSHALVRNHK